jgi:DNA-binding transcriptional MerR regulator
MDETHRSIGEVASATGLTVRALRHYDAIGLVRPSLRTGAGHRLYGDDDLARLARVVALRRLGLGLEQVASALDEEEPETVLRRHLAALERELELTAALRERLVRVLDTVGQQAWRSGDRSIAIIEVMMSIEQHYTPEQMVTLEARREALGEEGMAAGQQAWADLLGELKAELEAGTDPTEPRLAAHVDRWDALLAQFTGGDAGIRAGLQSYWDEHGPEKASQGMVDTEVYAYAQRIREAHAEGC